MNAQYFAAIVSSTLRMCTPILYATLAAALCTKAQIFNLSMEGAMLASAFFSIVVNHFTHSALLSVLAGVVSSVAVSAIVGFFILKLKASPVVVGLAMNATMAGVTSYLLYVFFKTKGVFTNPALVGLPKVNLSAIPFLGDMLAGLTVVDYLAFAAAFFMFIYLYKTVPGFRLRAMGINPAAAKSLGTPVARNQFCAICFSGMLSGLGGVLLSMGSVTLFIQNITSGKGYIAIAANNLGQAHPLGVLAASLFFGCCQALGNFLQNTSLKGQITASIPYVATILALMLFTLRRRIAKRQRMEKALRQEGA